MTKPLVTIGILADRFIEDMSYTINMILAQNYENIEIIVSIDECTGIKIGEIIAILNSHEKPINIGLYYNKEKKDIYGNIKQIIQKTNGKYVLFLQNNDAFYDGNAITHLVNQFSNSCKMVSATTAIFTEDNQYLTNVNNQCICFNTEYLKEIYKTTDKLYNIYCLAEKEGLLGVSPECCMRSTKYDSGPELNTYSLMELKNLSENKKINFTGITYFRNLVRQSLNAEKNDIFTLIDNKIEYIVGKQQGGYWDITDSDYVLMYFLMLLKETLNNIFFLKKSKLKQLLVNMEKLAETRIKLVFFAQEYSVWPSLQSVYETALCDDRFDVKLVYLPFEYQRKVDCKEEMKPYEKAGYNIINYDQYNLSSESPDVAILVKPYGFIPKQFYIDDLDKVVRRTILCTYAMTTVDNDVELIRLLYKLPLHYLAWRNLSYNVRYSQMMEKYSYNDGKNLLKIGHPRFDNITTKKIINHEFANNVLSRSKGRKIVFWNTHHSITPEGFSGTFLDNGIDILNYFKNNKDIFLLWRPHPLFFATLEKEYNDSDKTRNFWKDIENQENIMMDRESGYLTTINISDALISDVSSLVDEFLISQKPIMILKKKDKYNLMNPELENRLYIYENEKDLSDFINNVINNKDVLLQKRLEFIKKYYYIPERGTVAENLLENIILGIKKEETDIN